MWFKKKKMSLTESCKNFLLAYIRIMGYRIRYLQKDKLCMGFYRQWSFDWQGMFIENQKVLQNQQLSSVVEIQINCYAQGFLGN